MQILIIWSIRLKPKQKMQIICLIIYIATYCYLIICLIICITTAARIKQCAKEDVINRKVFHHILKPLSIKEAV